MFYKVIMKDGSGKAVANEEELKYYRESNLITDEVVPIDQYLYDQVKGTGFNFVVKMRDGSGNKIVNRLDLEELIENNLVDVSDGIGFATAKEYANYKEGLSLRNNPGAMDKAITDARKEVYESENPLLSTMYSVAAPGGYEESMKSGSMGINIEDVKDVAPTLAGAAIGGVAGAALTKAIPAVVKGAGLLNIGGRVAARNLVPAMIEEGTADATSLVLGEDQETAVEGDDYIVASVLSSLGVIGDIASPLAKAKLLSKFRDAGAKGTDEELLRTAGYAFKNPEGNVLSKKINSNFMTNDGKVNRATVSEYLKKESDDFKIDLQSKIDEATKAKNDFAYELRTLDRKHPNFNDVKGDLDLSTDYLNNLQAQMKNVDKNLQDNLIKLKKDDGFAMTIASELEQGLMTGEYKIPGYTLAKTPGSVTARKYYGQVDSPNSPVVQAMLDKVSGMQANRGAFGKLSNSGMKPEYSFTGIANLLNPATPSNLYGLGFGNKGVAARQLKGAGLLSAPVNYAIDEE